MIDKPVDKHFLLFDRSEVVLFCIVTVHVFATASGTSKKL
jgi:hypothetical protein